MWSVFSSFRRRLADLENGCTRGRRISDEVIRGRMSRPPMNSATGRDYDYIVVNHNVDDAFAEVQSILKAERLKRERRTGLTDFVRRLQRQLEK